MTIMSTPKSRSLWQDGFYRLQKNKLAIIGIIILLIIGISALLAPWLSPYSYAEQDLALGASPPSAQHWLGTDTLGRDLFTRILYGSRVSLMVGIVATTVALIIGITWGLVAGYIGGIIDNTMMRIVDILYALPFSIFIILLTVIFGKNIILLFLAIGAVEWLTMARIVRGQVLSLRKQEFVDAAITMGVSSNNIMFKHILPNAMGPIVIYTTLTIPNVILLESFLSFLGLGIQAPQSSWGSLISEGVESMEEYPWLLIFPGFILSATLFSLNFIGDGLRDAFDPRMSEKTS